VSDENRSLERLWSVHEIRQLAYRYAYSVDFRDVEMYRELWAKGGEPVEYPDFDLHKAEKHIGEWPDRGPSILMVCNHLIDFDDDAHAHGSVYCLVQTGWGEDFLEQSIMYQDRYVVEDGAWRFAARRHLLWFGERRDHDPFRQHPANWPEKQYGVGTLPGEIPSYAAFLRAARSAK
jgi:hypothetical protein